MLGIINMNIIEEFKKYARNASYHYADDSTKEWSLARKNVGLCRELYRENEHLRESMRKIVDRELWSTNELTKDID